MHIMLRKALLFITLAFMCMLTLVLILPWSIKMFSPIFNPIYAQNDFQNTVRKDFLNALVELGNGSIFHAKELTPFLWDRMCVFGMGASNEYINHTIGLDWLQSDGYIHEDRQVVVFVYKDAVVQHLVFRPRIFGSATSKSERLGICLTPEQAAFEVQVFEFSSGNYKLFMLPDR